MRRVFSNLAGSYRSSSPSCTPQSERHRIAPRTTFADRPGSRPSTSAAVDLLDAGSVVRLDQPTIGCLRPAQTPVRLHQSCRSSCPGSPKQSNPLLGSPSRPRASPTESSASQRRGSRCHVDARPFFVETRGRLLSPDGWRSVAGRENAGSAGVAGVRPCYADRLEHPSHGTKLDDRMDGPYV